jgi:hypothetical protein
MTFELSLVRRCDRAAVLRHAYFSYIVTAAAVVFIRSALKIAKNDNGYANALLCYLFKYSTFLLKILN